MPQVSTRTATAPRTTARAKPTLVDFRHLDRQTMGDADLARELLVLYHEQAPGLLREIVESDDGRSVREAAHRLTGAARAIGAEMVASAANQLEVKLMSRDFQRGFPGEGNLIAHVSQAVDETQAVIAAHLETAP